jgi:Holliday junction resolvase
MKIKAYRKGYTGERELVYRLYEKGYMVLRSPRSGRISLPTPDIIAIKKGKIFVIECKSRKSGFKIYETQINQLREWVEKAGAKAFVAWKITREGWKFIPLEEIIKNEGNVGKEFCNRVGLDFEKAFE